VARPRELRAGARRDAETAGAWDLRGGAALLAGKRAVPGRRARRPGLAAAAARKLGRDRTDVHRNRAPHRALLRETRDRLAARQAPGHALFNDAAGNDNVLPSGIILGSGHWVPTAPLVIGVNTLALSGDPLQVSFRFVPLNGSRWSVDDVYVDPYRTN
jgi:hypothetical protein